MPGFYFFSQMLSARHGAFKITDCTAEPDNSFANFKDYSEALLNLSVNEFGRDLGTPTDTLFDVKGKNSGGNEFS